MAVFVSLFCFLTCMFASLAQECGKQLIESRIVGGVDAIEGSWPWQVDIQTSTGHICGGSIISNQWVLSAAHCFPKPINTAAYTIYAGRFQLNGLNKYESQYSVVDVVIPSGYVTPEQGQDIALVQLNTPITWTLAIQPICLPSAGISFVEGQTCYVTGWGDISEGVPLQGAGTLQQLMVPIIGQTSCQNMYQTQETIQNDMICAGYQAGGKDSCQGDSGGPLMCRMANNTWVQAGVVSFGLGCAQPNQPGVYAKVSAFSDFITSVVPAIQLHGRAEQNWAGGIVVLVSSLCTLMMVQMLR